MRVRKRSFFFFFLLECVWAYMTTSLKQADLRRGQYTWKTGQAQIKNTTDTQKPKRREQKHNTKGNHQTTKGKTEKERETKRK